MHGRVRRALALLLLIVGLAPGTWFYHTQRPWNSEVKLFFEPLVLPPKAVLARHLGPFELEAAWRMTSTYSGFVGYSALLPQPGGRLLAITDNGGYLFFSPPGAPPSEPRAGKVMPDAGNRRCDCDVEAAAQDPATETIWVTHEDTNAISRHDGAFTTLKSVRPPAMRHWPFNTGAEAMVRLADGRFIVVAEGMAHAFGSREHEAVLFRGDPLLGGKPARFTFAGAPQFSTTDMAQLPDGRVLILMRRLVWPFPLRFTGRIVIADPAAIRPGAVWQGTQVAKLSSTLPVDNFEGMAIEPREDGRVTVWLISDDNRAETQRILLWKLVVDPARLPGMQKGAGIAPRP